MGAGDAQCLNDARSAATDRTYGTNVSYCVRVGRSSASIEDSLPDVASRS